MKYWISLCQNFKVVVHTIRLPKQSTVCDVITYLKTKVLSHKDVELRLLEVFYHKIYKETCGLLVAWWLLKARYNILVCKEPLTICNAVSVILCQRWLKEMQKKKKEETRAHNAQLHAAVSVAGVAAAVATIAAATAAASASGKDEQMTKTNMAVSQLLL
ncbi:ubiquitin carboxyl-terminal hydrolase 12-like protein isoform X2 [Tanacetum coccineum]